MGASELPVQQEVQRGAVMTEYRLTGDLPQVFAAIDALFKNYAPAAYGTRVHEISCTYPVGPYVARMSRANSCE